MRKTAKRKRSVLARSVQKQARTRNNARSPSRRDLLRFSSASYRSSHNGRKPHTWSRGVSKTLWRASPSSERNQSMLTPQHHIQPVYQQCGRRGRLPVYVTAVCPSCGARLALPWQSQSSGPPNIAPFPPIVLPSQSPNYSPLTVELLLNFLGMYGVGWLMLGNIAEGLTLLIGSILLWPVVALLSIFTMGLGLVCLGPLALGAMIGNMLVLQRAIRPDAFEKPMREGGMFWRSARSHWT